MPDSSSVVTGILLNLSVGLSVGIFIAEGCNNIIFPNQAGYEFSNGFHRFHENVNIERVTEKIKRSITGAPKALPDLRVTEPSEA